MQLHLKAICYLIIFCFSLFLEAKINLLASPEKELLSQEILLKISNDHFLKNTVQEDVNLRLFDALLTQLDSEKIYFTKNEVASFNKKFSESSLTINLTDSYVFMNLYFNRLLEAANYQIGEIEKKNFDFYADEEIFISNDQKDWGNSKFGLRQSWKKLAKNDVLTSMLADNNLDEATEIILKRYKNRIRQISQRNEEDIFSIVMNRVTSIFDPHSSYFSPKSAEDFEMDMSLKLEGIGALLTTEDDYPTIVSLVPGGPADQSGKIEPDDKIVKVLQIGLEVSEAVDVVGWRIDEVVSLIRGASGTQLELELIPAKTEDPSQRKWVTLTRAEVKLEEQAAKSRIIEVKASSGLNKIGIIDLPAFYIDFAAMRNQDPNFRSSSQDVENILKDFNAKDVDGIIIDLRGNSGGSLLEASRLVSLFIASGITLQVKNNNGYIKPWGAWGSKTAKQVWSKPMAVMVNRYSASASEIFAGAIQDYQRGLIIGHQTFGKGTVQSLVSLSSGQIKITESKFYRITGEGMQNKGIKPDITLPATWDIQEIGESSLDASLPWDKIPSIRFNKFKMDIDLIDTINKAYLQRLDCNPNLQYLLDIRERYEIQKEKNVISLNINNRKKEKFDRKKWVLDTENNRRVQLELTAFKDFEELEKFREDKEDIDIDIDNDFLLDEASKILSDFMYLSNTKLIAEAA
ncbi:carboxy terminal-processing peptidase [Gammaproteobacteria bacterium]|nr:carboxy terminal-processing peptidase [Gammaproteobacteria bacterium]